MTITLSHQYRAMAKQARLDAQAALLPNVREAHLRSAGRFEEIARAHETTAAAKARNDAAKAAEWAQNAPVPLP